MTQPFLPGQQTASQNTPNALEEDVFVLPASFAQKRLWFLDQWEPGVYHITMAVRLTGQLDRTALEQALQEMVRRHEVLRTAFKMVDENLLQVIAPQMPFALTIVDLQKFPEDVRRVKLRRLVREDIQRPFDLRQGPLLRATLLQLGEQEHALLLTMHHIISDAWSMEVFFYELKTLYAAYVFGQPSPLPELTLQYADYAIWQQEWLQGEVLEEQMSYWKQQLANLPMLQLPLDHPRPAVQTFRGAAQILILPQSLTEQLKALSRREGVTLFMTLLAAYQTLLFRYTDQDDIVVGIPIAGRTDSKLEQLIGCFINTLALRTDLSGNPTFRELLARVREMTLGAYEHQDIPFEKLVEELQPERDLSRNPLTQVMFALQNVRHEQVHLPGLTLSPLKFDSETAMLKQGDSNWISRQQSFLDNEPVMCDLDLTMWERGDELAGEIKYNTDLLDEPTIIRMKDHFLRLLEAVVADPTLRITDLELLSEAERQQMLVEWNATSVEYPQEQSFVTLFEAQVARTPQALAAIDEHERITYQQLNQQANQIAHHLRDSGIGPENVVALLAERSISFLTAILAVFKASAAYLPLDPQHPTARLRHVLQHSNSRLVLTTSSFAVTLAEALEEIPPGARPPVLLIEDLLRHVHAQENLAVEVSPRHLAYVIYTSGSTGVPKGVMLEQQGMLNHLQVMIDDFQITHTDRIAQTASQCFDISVWQFLTALVVGGQVQIFPDEVIHDPGRLLEQVEQQKISILEIVPSMMRAMLEMLETGQVSKPEFAALRWLIPTAEALPTELCQRWFRLYPEIPLLNAYGPTECSDDVTFYPIFQLPDETHSIIPIGQAIANTQIYVLDKQVKPVPIGVSGELYIGGIGVGRGYLADAPRTAETFVPDPFSGKPGARLYKTGDVARYLNDGMLEFLGRCDHQVKIRGYRIELGEIEAVLRQHPAVRECAVLAKEDAPGNARLIAYVVARTGQVCTEEELQLLAKEMLPDYMVPSGFAFLDSLPLTPNGKLDRLALPSPSESRSVFDAAYVAPRTAIEAELVDIWAKLLGMKRECIGIHDDFFALGGHSLLTVRLLTQIQKQLNKNLPLAAIFQGRTIEALAEMLSRRGESSPWSSVVEVQEPVVDLLAEATLDLEVCPEVWPGELVTEPACLLLTGVTGFLGSFLLATLLQQTSAQIYCLVRASTDEQARQRVQEALEASGIDALSLSGSRIMVLKGDLAQPLLGLSSEQFEELAETVEVIYHCGAMVNTLYPYQELKAANVSGTKEILRLATHGRVKPLHYVSTVSVFSRTQHAQGKSIREQESIDDHARYLTGGYAQSKWVAEKLVTIARSRGLPVAIYRPGRITGHSETGAWRTDDLLCRMMKGCIQLGSVPMLGAGEQLELTPVDYVGKAIVALSRRKASLGQAFHLFNPATISIDEVVTALNACGYPVKHIAYDTWVDELARVVDEEIDNALAPLASLFPRMGQNGQQSQTPKRDLDRRNAMTALGATSITCPPADAQLISTYVAYLVKCGFLPVPQGAGATAKVVGSPLV